MSVMHGESQKHPQTPQLRKYSPVAQKSNADQCVCFCSAGEYFHNCRFVAVIDTVVHATFDCF